MSIHPATHHLRCISTVTIQGHGSSTLNLDLGNEELTEYPPTPPTPPPAECKPKQTTI